MCYTVAGEKLKMCLQAHQFVEKDNILFSIYVCTLADMTNTSSGELHHEEPFDFSLKIMINKQTNKHKL